MADKPKLTAASIRKMLKPMADFAPALMAVLEICDTAEAKEAEIPKLDKEIEDRQKTLADLDEQVKDKLGKAESARTSYNDKSAEIEKQIEVQRQELEDAKNQVAKQKFALDARIDEHNKHMEQLGKQRAEEERKLAAIKNELSRLAQHFSEGRTSGEL